MVKSLALLEFRSRKPLIMFCTIARPTDKVLITMSLLPHVQYLVNEVFFMSVFSDDRCRFFEVMRGEEHGIGFCVREDFGCVGYREDVGGVWEVEGDGRVRFVNVDDCVRAIIARHELCNTSFAFSLVIIALMQC